MYLKIYANDEVIKHLAELYDIDIDNAGHNFIPDYSCRCRFRKTELTKEDEDVFKRKGYEICENE